MYVAFFFFNDTATTEIYTLSLHDALPICSPVAAFVPEACLEFWKRGVAGDQQGMREVRSEEHTSELQSQSNLVCRLLLEKKKQYPRFFEQYFEPQSTHAEVPRSSTRRSRR